MTVLDDFGQFLAGVAEIVGRLVESAGGPKTALLANDKVTALIQPERTAVVYADSGRLREASAPVISRVV